jgi:hypothetical protein
MKIVIPPLAIESTDGFKSELDLFCRKPFGEALTRLVARSQGDLVISLDGRWGEGKSTFIKMWQGHLAEAAIPSIYIDAFENDYSEDAFISIASAITSYTEANGDSTGKTSAFKESAKKVGVQLLSWSAKVAIKAATLGALEKADIDSLTDIGSDVATSASNAVSELIKDRLGAHSKQAAVISAFKSELSQLPSQLKGNDSGRLVIVIDELDRCKPTFSVEVLEKIKHFFSVPNVVFVLVMNKEQLEESIRSVYGANIDAQTYLQKFIHIETTLPKRAVYRGENDLNIYSKRLLELHAFEHWGDGSQILQCMSPLAAHFNLSLRQLEKTYTNLAIIYSTSAKDHLRLVMVITFIATLKVVKPSLFRKLSVSQITYEDLVQQLGLPLTRSEESSTRDLFGINEWLACCLLSESELKGLGLNDRASQISQSLWRYNVEPKRIIPIFCDQLNMFSAN